MRSIRDIPQLENVPVLVRTALNVPIEDGAVSNEYRLRKAVPTITYLALRGARVILISHIGEDGTETLEPVYRTLKGKYVPNLSFCADTIGSAAREAIAALPPGGVLMLENLRRSPGETANDPAFAKALAELADVFVEDSFDTCHRAHASIIGVPALLPSYAGFVVEEEVAALSGALSPASPSLAIVGGAKFSTKEKVLDTLLASYDRVFVGGALADDFLAAKGFEIGKSLASGGDAEKITALLAHPKLMLPTDVRVVRRADQRESGARARARVARADDVRADEVILDIGPATSAALAQLVKGGETVLWNGPLGNYENGFVDATDALAQALAASDARSVVGGGDTVASIERLGLVPKFSFVSTGGGAMLEFLAHGTLPGIEVLESSAL